MTTRKVRTLGIIYTFITTFVCLVPFVALAAFFVVINKVAETKEIGVDRVENFEYDLESITPEGWQLIAEGRNSYLDIIACSVLLFSIVEGRKIGKKYLIDKNSSTDRWDRDLIKVFRYSFSVGSILWYSYFILLLHGFFPSILELIISLFIFAIMILIGSGGLSVLVGEPLLKRIFRFHLK